MPPAAVVEAVLKFHDVAPCEEGNPDRVLLRLSSDRSGVLDDRAKAAVLSLHGDIKFQNIVIHGEPRLEGQAEALYVLSAPPAPLERPPRRADQILCLIYSPERLEDVAGTMEELFHKVAARHGPGYAQLWYWCQVLGCVFGRLRALTASLSDLVGLKRT